MKNKLALDILNLHNKYFLDKKKLNDIYSFFTNSRYNIDVVYENDILVAYIIIYDAVDSYELFEIATNENFRNKGYAKKLLDNLPLDKEIFLEVSENNKEALNLYLSYGFKKISTRKNYYLDNSSAIILKR